MGKWFGIALLKIIYHMDSYLYQMYKLSFSRKEHCSMFIRCKEPPPPKSFYVKVIIIGRR